MGTYVHMMWECPGVSTFWAAVASFLSDIIELDVPCLPHILLLNDDSSLNITLHKKRIFLAGLTAAKKNLVMRWKPPHNLSIHRWKISFYEVLKLEASSARAQGANTESIQTLFAAAQKVKSLLD